MGRLFCHIIPCLILKLRQTAQANIEIPTLRQLFELIRDSGDKDIKLSIEAKTFPSPDMGIEYEKSPEVDALLTEFLNLVEEFGFQYRVLLQAFDWAVLVKMEELNPAIETVALYSEQPSWGTVDSTTLWLDREESSPWLAGLNIHDFDDDPVKAAASLGFDVVSPYHEELTPEQVKEAHENGMKVVPWTVNRVEDMERMYEMGVEGVVTDRPWIIREYLQSKGDAIRPTAKVDLSYHLEPDHFEVEAGQNSNGMDSAY